MRKFVSLFLLGLLTTNLNLFSQQNNFINYTVKEGLPQSSVLVIIQDSRSYLWIGTDGGGLCRFNGTDFQTFTQKKGLSGNIIRSIMEDSKGNLWIGTDNGISLYDGLKFVTINNEDGLSGKYVLKIIEDHQKNIWAATDDGGVNRIEIVQKDSFIISHITKEDGLITNFVFDIHEDQYERIWLATVGGVEIIQFSEDKFNIEHLSNSFTLPDKVITSIEEDDGGSLWFGTVNSGVFRVSDFSDQSSGIITVYDTLSGMNNNMVWDISKDESDKIWVATNDGGVNIFSSDKIKYLTSKHGMPSNQIYSIYQDNEKNIWMGGANGLCKFLGEHFSHYGKLDKLKEQNIYNIKQDNQGNLWLATYGGGLIKMCIKHEFPDFEFFTKANGLADNNITSISINENNVIWFSYAQKGIGRIENTGIKNYTTADGLINDRVNCLFTDSHENLWCGTSGGISVLSKDGFFNFNLDKTDGLCDDEITTIIQDRTGDIWIGTYNGLMKYDWKSLHSYDEAEGLFDKRIHSLVEDNTGNIWIGTFGGGLYKFDIDVNDSIPVKQVANSDFISSNNIYSLIFQNDSTLIVGTEKGFDKILLDADKKIFSIKNYNEQDGFFSIENNLNAIFKDLQDNIWFGTVSSLTRYNPHLEHFNLKPPDIYLTGIKLNYEEVNWESLGYEVQPWFNIPVDLKLAWSENNLTFQYSGINLTNPEKLKYRYMLEGLTSSMSPPTSANEVVYSGLYPGQYTFKLIAENENGIWNKKPYSFNFTIEPPFWRTWWFYVIVVLSVCLIIFIYIKYREKQLILKNRELEIKVIDRTAKISRQKAIIEAKNQDITASIVYAKRIQDALLPSEKVLKENVNDCFILLKPRDIVSGDFYWVAKLNTKLIIVAADCTGHGVPGAFMSMLGISFLNEIVAKEKSYEPGKILDLLREYIISALKQQGTDSSSKDGMDIAICTIDTETNILQFAGANNPLYIVRDGELEVIKHDRMPVAIYSIMNNFVTHTFEIKQGDTFYIFSDGYIDQFGGPLGKKFKSKAFMDLFISIQEKDMDEQKTILENTFEKWSGNYPQVDDIVVIGIRYLSY
ncbi:two-component regulator propeller domain-containing protein [Bacteroidota bacterium]